MGEPNAERPHLVGVDHHCPTLTLDPGSASKLAAERGTRPRSNRVLGEFFLPPSFDFYLLCTCACQLLMHACSPTTTGHEMEVEQFAHTTTMLCHVPVIGSGREHFRLISYSARSTSHGASKVASVIGSPHDYLDKLDQMRNFLWVTGLDS